jgi:pimeloyl-ACP methyl ester carboxylesterase
MVSATHSPLFLRDPNHWVLYLSERQAQRLVVFVHGFGGGVTESWDQFLEGGRERPEWWVDSDLLFVGYSSTRDSIAGVAYRVRTALPRFYPMLSDDLIEVDGLSPREPGVTHYQELYLVGHSLGGVIVRRILCDAACEWEDQMKSNTAAPRPAVLDARTRLFSPASKGFRPAGWLGALSASPAWPAVMMQLRRSSAFTDLQPGSEILVRTEQRTAAHLGGPNAAKLDSLRASILWAEPDDVVASERWDGDPTDHFEDGTTHRSVCKPKPRVYTSPWVFVETGRP